MSPNQPIELPLLPVNLPESLRTVSLAPKQAIEKVRYSHEAMADMIISDPWIAQGTLARNFGYTEGWVSQVIASDAFQAHLAERKEALVDPALRATVEERFKALISKSTAVLLEKLAEKSIDPELALGIFSAASKAAGYGARGPSVQVNTQYVVQVPNKEISSESWVANHAPGQTITESIVPTQIDALEVLDAEIGGS